jgi:hypothetical protein
MEFMLAILQQLLELPEDADMAGVVHEQYKRTLHRWHGMLCSSAFSVGWMARLGSHRFAQQSCVAAGH